MAINKIYSTLSDAQSRINDIEENEMILIEEEKKVYVRIGDELKVPEVGEIDVRMSQYDINKQIYAQMEPLSVEELEKHIAKINEVLVTDERKMLLCREYNYYTIFEHFDVSMLEFDNLGAAVITCVQDCLGDIMDICETTEAFEIWFKNPDGLYVR